MGMTITEKILAAHCNKDVVSPGEIIEADVDLAFGNDITAPIAIELLKKYNISKVFDTSKVMVIPDHFTPNKDIKSALHAQLLRNFAQEYDLKNYAEVGRVGIEHVWLPEQGFTQPGMVIIGADSHTCTYGALGAFSTGVGSTDLAATWITGKCWFKIPDAMLIQLEGKLSPWVSGKDIILYLIGKIGVNGANYQSLEYSGPAISELSMADRFTISNMAIEAGAKNGIFPVDNITKKYVQETSPRSGILPRFYESDKNAEYLEKHPINVSEIEPQVAFPHLPENSKPISEVKEILIDQAIIGSCTNGRIEDLKIAAAILHERKVHSTVRCIIIPGTPEVYEHALDLGFLKTFIKAGAVVSPPTCGPCLGGHMGILAKGERAISTTNRNFVGRMGHPESEVYLSNPAIAAASAVLGYIGSPKDLVPEPKPVKKEGLI